MLLFHSFFDAKDVIQYNGHTGRNKKLEDISRKASLHSLIVSLMPENVRKFFKKGYLSRLCFFTVTQWGLNGESVPV